MPSFTRMVATEIVMCGLKSVPLVGKAVEVVQGIDRRYQAQVRDAQLAEMERQISSFDRRLRDLVRAEMADILTHLRRPDLDGPSLTAHIRNLRAIQEHSPYVPALFEGLLDKSRHWDELKRHPEHYGTVLADGQVVNPQMMQILIDTETTRILELSPFTFASLLAQQDQRADDTTFRVGEDIWAFSHLAPAQNPPLAPLPGENLGHSGGQRTFFPGAVPGGRTTPTRQDAREEASVLPPSEMPSTLTNSIGMEFVLIPAGEFLMGSPEDEPGRLDDEGPQHRVRISRPFYMGRYAVTQEQWETVMGSNPSRFKPSRFKGAGRPVERVSWEDVQEFIRRLDTREEGHGWVQRFIRRPKASEEYGRYRLPTEAEWEYAARAGTTTAYSFGDNPCQLGTYAWFKDYARGQTHPVGQKCPNPWDLYDMHGNVLEWVQDWYGDYAAGSVTDPQGPTSGSYRVNRGGSWGLSAGSCRSAFRYYYEPDYRYGGLGFRLLRTAP